MNAYRSRTDDSARELIVTEGYDPVSLHGPKAGDQTLIQNPLAGQPAQRRHRKWPTITVSAENRRDEIYAKEGERKAVSK